MSGEPSGLARVGDGVERTRGGRGPVLSASSATRGGAFGAANDGFQVFETERQLLRIEFHRTASELLAQQLFADQHEHYDLPVAPLIVGNEIADQLLQQRMISRQIVEGDRNRRPGPGAGRERLGDCPAARRETTAAVRLAQADACR